MGINARRLQVRVPERLRDERDGRSLVDCVAGVGMSQPMGVMRAVGVRLEPDGEQIEICRGGGANLRQPLGS